MTVSVNRRDFAKGLGGIVLAFTLDPALARTAATAARCCRQPQWQSQAGCLDPHQRRRQRDRLHRQGGAGAGHRHRARADRRRRARSAARAGQYDFRRHRPHPERGNDGRQSVGRELRDRAASRGRRSARHPDRACLVAARDERGFAQRRGRRDQRSERQAHLLRGACRLGRPQSRGERDGTSEAGRPAQDRRSVDQALRHSR